MAMRRPAVLNDHKNNHSSLVVFPGIISKSSNMTMNIRIRSFASGLLALMLVVMAFPVRAAAVTNQSIGALVFEKPGANSYWDDVRNAGKSSVPFMVANPVNGPGVAADPAYTDALNKNSVAGIRTLGYIQTNFQTRSFKESYNDIDTWFRLYPQATGIYIDLVKEGGQAEVCYAAALYTHIKNVSPNDLVVLSPGTHISPAYEPYGDIFVTANSDYATYAAWKTQHKGFEDKPQYQNRFWHVIHSVSSDNYSNAFTDVRSNNAGWVYMTDKGEPSPFTATPSFWQNETSDVGALPESAIPNRGMTSLPRGCISLSSSAESTVDTRSAKQSTTSSIITVNNTSQGYDSEPTTAIKIMSLPKGVTLTAPKGDAWKCTADSCAYSAVLAAASSAPVIKTALQANCDYAGGDAMARLTNYAGNQWDLKLPVRAPYGCEASTSAGQLNPDTGGDLATITTQSSETTPDITPLGGLDVAAREETKKVEKKGVSAMVVGGIILGTLVLAGLGIWGYAAHRKREAYRVEL